MAPVEGVRMRFDHVSIAVRSIDRAMEFFGRYFPVQPRNQKREEEQVSGKFHWQDFYLGGFVVELIEDPPKRAGFVTRFIDKYGEGMHHLSIEVDNLEPLLCALKEGGVRVVDEQHFADGGATAFISPQSAFGTLIQFWQVPNFDQPHPRPAPNGLAHFDHVSLAVRSIEKAYGFFSRYLGAVPGHEPHLNHRGNFQLGHVEVAGFKLEFIQSPDTPVKDDFVRKFIDTYGEGMHHVSIDLKEYDATLTRLKRDGVRVVGESKNWRGEREFFISPSAAFGVLVQVWDGI